MALVNPANLYSGGQGILRDDYVNFIANQEAKKRAREDALNQYFTKLSEKLNTAGVRQQDLYDPNTGQGILKDIEEWKKQWNANPEAVKRGGLGQQAYMAMYQQILNRINQSKQRAKTELELGKAKFEGKFSPRTSDLPVLEKIGKSIYDPTSYKEDGVSEYGIQDLSSAVGQYTPKDQMAFEKAAIGQYKPEYDPASKAIQMDDSGKILLTKKYKPEHILQIGQQAANLVKGDKKARYYYEDMLEVPDAVKTASDALSKVAGTKVIPQTPEEMAAGLTMAKLANVEVKEEEKDVAAANRFKKQLQDERIAAALKRTKLVEAGKNARVKAMLGGVEIEDVISNAAKKGVKYPWEGKGEVTLVPLRKLDPLEVEDILGKKTEYGYPIKPFNSAGEDYIVINENGEVETPEGVINPDRVKNNTYNRTKGILKATYKKEVKNPEGTGAKPATNLLNATKRRKG